MNGMFAAILTQASLLVGTSAGFNQPGSTSPSEYFERVNTETVEKNISLRSGGLILLDTQFGNVAIEEYEGKEVKVELRLRGTPEAISNFRFTHNYFGNQVTLKAWYERNPGPKNYDLQQAEFVVMVPRSSSYAIRAVTKQGNIDAAVTGSMKNVELLTEAGRIHLAVPSDISACIDASTSGLGEVRINPMDLFAKLCPECEVRTDSHLKVKMNGGGCPISAYSGIGSVHFEITSPINPSQS